MPKTTVVGWKHEQNLAWTYKSFVAKNSKTK